MSDSTYKPPSASLETAAPRKPRSTIAAVLIGAILIDVCGTLVLVSIASFVWMVVLAIQGVPEEQLAAALQTPGFLAITTPFGFGMTVLGGYMAGRWARHSEVRHGFFVGLVSLALGVLMMSMEDWDGPLWLSISSFVLTVPLGALGGWIAARSSA